MPGTGPRYRLPSTEQITRLIAETREVIADAVALLKSHPEPNAFAGRKTQEPFPAENNGADAWLDFRNLQPPQ